MDQSEFLAITRDLFKAWEKSHLQGVIGLDFASHRLKIWHKIFKLITTPSNCNRAITFNCHLKTVLLSKK